MHQSLTENHKVCLLGFASVCGSNKIDHWYGLSIAYVCARREEDWLNKRLTVIHLKCQAQLGNTSVSIALHLPSLSALV